MTRKLSIGMIGTRGIPNQYGGYEAALQELAPRLAALGHRVVVYCSHHQIFKQTTWKGVELTFHYNPEDKLGSAGQFIYDLNCNLHARKQHFDVILHLGYTSDSVWHRLWDPKARHICNMDGMEWMRSKYSHGVQHFLKKAEKWAALRSDLLIADSAGVYQYLEKKYPTPIALIAYGAEVPHQFKLNHLTAYGLKAFEYDLLIARMEPENNIEMAMEAKIDSGNTVPLVVFGNENKYAEKLNEKYKALPVIKFFRANYNQDVINALRYYSRYYVHGHSVGGTNPSLLEAMAAQCRILAHNNIFNKGVLQGGGQYFSDAPQLSRFFNLQNSDLISRTQIDENLKSIRTKYNWEQICQQYEAAFYQVL
ncbi:MAG: DUF1972 domain-containing protein [Bacteroidales bacterium]